MVTYPHPNDPYPEYPDPPRRGKTKEQLQKEAEKRQRQHDQQLENERIQNLRALQRLEAQKLRQEQQAHKHGKMNKQDSARLAKFRKLCSQPAPAPKKNKTNPKQPPPSGHWVCPGTPGYIPPTNQTRGPTDTTQNTPYATTPRNVPYSLTTPDGTQVPLPLGTTRSGEKYPYTYTTPDGTVLHDAPYASIDFSNPKVPMSVPDPTVPLRHQFPYPDPNPPSGFANPTLPNPPDTTAPPSIDPNPPSDPPPTVVVPPPPPPSTQCPSYHPSNSIPGKMSQAAIVNAITAYVNAKGYKHDPDGIPWIPRGNWVAWDRVTTINPCVSTKAQIIAFVFPPPGGVNTMRGLRERFYEVNPFADNANPTVAEIENWNIEVIRHFRKLLGFNQTTHPVYNDKCTYLKAAWAEERARTNYWSASYPGALDSAAGPCTLPNSPLAHCGAGFLPNPADQAPYLCPSDMAPCTATSGAEGIQNINTDLPWSIKMARIIGQYLASDGIDNHTGPFIGRSLFGSAWYINSPPTSTSVRTKWGGNLVATCP